MSMDIKLDKAKLSKIDQKEGFLGVLLNKFVGSYMKFAIPFLK